MSAGADLANSEMENRESETEYVKLEVENSG